MKSPEQLFFLDQQANKKTIRIAFFSLSFLILLAIGVVFILQQSDGTSLESFVLLLGTIPVFAAIGLIHFGKIETAGGIIGTALTIMITVLATIGQGVYDIGTMAYPAILIIASLVLKKNTVVYLAGLTILCNGWLVFGAIYGIYQPNYPEESFFRQFLISSLILLITMFAVYVLSNTVRRSLKSAQSELEERQRVEQALRNAENMYRTLVEQTSVVIYRDAPAEEGNTSYISPQIERLLGYSMKEWERNPQLWRELTHPDDLQMVLSEIKKYLKTGERSVTEYRMKTKDNRWVWFQDESIVITDNDGSSLYVHGVLIDITNRKNAEQKIKQREAILGAVAETAQLLLKSRNWREDVNTVLKLLGEAAGASHVYIFENHKGNNGELLSSQRYEWTKPGKIPELNNPDYQNTKLKPLPNIEDWYNNLRTGKPFYGSKSQYPDYWEERFDNPGLKTILDVPITVNGQWWGIIGFDDYENELPWSKAETDALIAAAGNLGTAIARQQSDDELRISEEKFELAFHHTYVAMAISGVEDHNLVDVNDAFTKISGFSREDAIGKRAGRDLKIWPNQSDRDFILNTLQEKGYIDEYRAEFRRKNGEIGVGLLSAVNVTISGKQCQLYTFYDISKLDQLMSELKSKNDELQSFTYTVSHDLKAPLVTISGFLGYLEEDVKKGDSVRVNKDILRITEAVKKMQRLLNELLELSRIGRMMNPPENVPFGEIVQDALRVVEGLLQEKHVKVEVDADLPSIYGDRVRLTEIIQNLVDNAAKFTGNQSHPVIRIGTRMDNGTQVFFVSDNGIGIEEDHRERVFGLFNKLDANTEGTGIGLALVKKIVEVHEGTIWIENNLTDTGTTFCFTLAAVPERGAA